MFNFYPQATACAIFHQFNEAFANLSLAAIVGETN